MWRLRTGEIVDDICIIMIILGTMGNLLGLIVFCSRRFRRTTYGRLAIASLIINLLCVYRYSLLLHSETRRWITYKVGERWFYCKLYRLSSCLRILSSVLIVVWTYERYSYVTNNIRFLKTKMKFYFLTILSLIIVLTLTGPTVYFYHPKRIFLVNRYLNLSSNASNQTLLSSMKTADDDQSQMICGLKSSISLSWRSFLIDVRFGLNYTTLRSIISEIIPSILVFYFNIGIIICVIQSQISFSTNKSQVNIRQHHLASTSNRCESHDGLIVHNRPRTSWMNLVLIIHSCLFVFSSLTATIVHWSTSNALLSYWTSVVILANSSLNFYVYCLSGKSFRNEIRKLFSHYIEYYCFIQCLNLFRTKSQREQIRLNLRMNSVRYRSTTLQPATTQLRTPSFVQR